jgi:hypothetical protein
MSRNWIRRLRVSGGGYVDGLDLLLAPGANVICGEPGAGKSTALALVRYVLGLPVPPARREAFDSLIATNLGSGRAHVTLVTAHGAEYELSRAGGEAGPRIDSPVSAQGIAGAAFATQLFPIRFAGHGELELMATDGLARLDLLARFAWEDVERLRADLARVRAELDANAEPLLRLDREIAELAKKCAALPAQRARLEELKKAAGGDPAALDAANQRKALRERERMMLEGAAREVAWLRSELGVLVATARRRLGQVGDAAALAGPNADLLADVGGRLQGAAGAVESMATRIAEDCATSLALVAERSLALAARHAVDDDAYRALLATHESNAGRAFERLTLEKSVAELGRAQSERDARVGEREQVLAARDVLRARSRAISRELTSLLERTAKRLTGELSKRVKIEVSPEAERTAYRKLLGELVKGKRFEASDLDAVAATISPDDLCAQVLAGDTSVLEDKLGSKAVAMRLASTLLESPRVYRLETVDVADVPTISLLHGETYKPSHELSSGQRTVAFVSILLLDKRGPLVVDQPEDNVANRYLAEYLCGVFADVQKDVQLVFVTHNGNIPILGQAERVFEMQADGQRGWIASEGPAKAVLGPMENNFEGGRGAFVQRKDFYGVA